MPRLFTRLMLIVLVGSIVAACGGAPAAPAPTPAPAPTEAPVADEPATAHYPITIATCEGSETFTEAPSRVFVDYQPQVELLLRLGLGDRIAGYTGVGEVPIAEDVAAVFAAQVAPKTAYEQFPVREVALSADYDLAILAFPEYVLDPAQGRATRAEWQSVGTKVYDSKADCAGAGAAGKTLEASFTQIRDLGLIFNVEDRAAALIAEMEATLADVAQRVAGRPTPRIAILDYIDEQGTPSFYAAGLYTDLITRAGGTNVFADQQEQYVTISPEVVAERPVDVLAVMEWAGGISAAEKAEYYFSTFPNAPASQERRFVVLTNMDLNAGSGNANAVAKLARALHPEAFGTVPAPETARYPVTIEQCGVQLTFTEPPQRVLATWQSMAEVLLALGLEDRIIGVYYGQFYPSTAPGMEEAMARLNALTDGQGGAPPREVVIAAQPDFIYSAYPGSDFNAERGRASREDLAAIGAQIFGSSADCAADASQLTVATVYDDIRKLGLIFGVPERAEALITEMQERVAAVQARIAGRTPTSMIFYDAGEGPLGVYGSGLNNDMIRLAGGQNLFGDQPETYLNVGVEAFAAQPAAIFAIIDYEGFAGVPDEATRVDFLFSTFPNMPASQERRSVFVPGAAFAAGMRFPEAIEIMARAFHPDAFDAASAGEPATYPVTIENCGNTLTFTQAPERIAPLYPPVTEMLLLLGLGDRIVGIGGSGTEPVLTELQAAYQALPRLAESSAIPREVLLAAEPELVLDNQPDYFYDASQGFATREEIAAAGAQIYTLSAKCDGGKLDATMEDVYTDLRNLGAIFGVSAQAEAEISRMQARIAAVTTQLDGVEPVSVIYYDAGEGPLGIFGPGTWEYVFNLAGATNAFSDLSESYAQISIEEVATRAADVIVVAGYEGGEKTAEERAAFIRSAFPNSTAVQNDRVFVVPYEYTNPGIQNVLGVEFLARALHPERFAE